MVRAKNYGRMGNSLFQNACAIGYALKHGLEFSVPTQTKNNFWSPLYLQHLVNPKWIEGKEDIVIKEKGMPYQELPFEESWRGKQIVLDGYWQSWKYIQPYRKEILDFFNFGWALQEDMVSVHVRRGDYVELRNKHPEVTVEWYEKAMSMFPDKVFVFFSDDIQWCKDNFRHKKDCEFEHWDILHDLENASCNESCICSSSTYSFWIYWLNRNPNKIGIFPEKWFTDGWDGADTSDILPPEVIKL